MNPVVENDIELNSDFIQYKNMVIIIKINLENMICS